MVSNSPHPSRHLPRQFTPTPSLSPHRPFGFFDGHAAVSPRPTHSGHRRQQSHPREVDGRPPCSQSRSGGGTASSLPFLHHAAAPGQCSAGPVGLGLPPESVVLSIGSNLAGIQYPPTPSFAGPSYGGIFTPIRGFSPLRPVQGEGSSRTPASSSSRRMTRSTAAALGMAGSSSSAAASPLFPPGFSPRPAYATPATPTVSSQISLCFVLRVLRVVLSVLD